MRTTVTIDNDLFEKAARLTGATERSTVIREGLKALVERESARRLALLGGSETQLKNVTRRRSELND